MVLYEALGWYYAKPESAKTTAEPLLWHKTISKEEDKKDEDDNQSKRNKGLDTSFLRKASDSHLLVAALFAAVSFAASFILPGGYSDSDGMAILSNRPAFKAFVVSDSMAVVLSLAVVLCHFYTALTNN